MPGILESIFSAGVGTVLTSAGTFAKDIREAITGKAIMDPAKQAEIIAKAQEQEYQMNVANLQFERDILLAQAKINELEATNKSVFVSGWRPYLGWICGNGLAYEFLFRPIFPWIVEVACVLTGKVAVIPKMTGLDLEQLLVLTFGMLGLGTQRMMEKKWGVASK